MHNKGNTEIGVLIIFLILIGTIYFLYTSTNKYHASVHSDDVTITEWVSPDGVHYWYQQAGYHAMLAPRYDKNGNLVIDKVVE